MKLSLHGFIVMHMCYVSVNKVSVSVLSLYTLIPAVLISELGAVALGLSIFFWHVFLH